MNNPSSVKIPKSIKEIITVFISRNFNNLTIEEIANALDDDINTIAQRINRNESYFEVFTKRPKKIGLKSGNNEIIFYRDKNQCYICKKTFPSTELTVRPRQEDVADKDHYNNLITVCVKCKDKPTPRHSSKAKEGFNHKKDNNDIWEYKQIIIAKRLEYRGGNLPFSSVQFGLNKKFYSQWGMEPSEYYEFDELNGKGWFHFTDKNDESKITSLTLIDVLEEFGKAGWELTFMRDITKKSEIPWGTDVFGGFVNYNEPSSLEEFECILKRKKRRT